MTALAPSLAKARAVALPMPELPPVTRATFPSNRFMGIPPVTINYDGLVKSHRKPIFVNPVKTGIQGIQ
jgi:hypothetical protein